MTKLAIRHEYRDGPQRRHHFNSGWLEEAVCLLTQAAGKITLDGVDVRDILKQMEETAAQGRGGFQP